MTLPTMTSSANIGTKLLASFQEPTHDPSLFGVGGVHKLMGLPPYASQLPIIPALMNSERSGILPVYSGALAVAQMAENYERTKLYTQSNHLRPAGNAQDRAVLEKGEFRARSMQDFHGWTSPAFMRLSLATSVSTTSSTGSGRGGSAPGGS